MNLRLEQENDDLAHELVNSKISLRNDLDCVSVLYCVLCTVTMSSNGSNNIRLAVLL